MNNKSKICFFSPTSYELFFETDKVTHGGAKLQLYFLAKKLAEKDFFSIKFIVGNYKQKKQFYFQNIEFIKAFNLLKKENLISKLFKGIKLFFLLIKLNPNIIITSTANTIVGIVYLYKTIFKKKHIHRTAHLIDVDKTWIKNSGLSGKIYKLGLEKADLIITQNLAHKKLLKINHKKNAVVLKNAVIITNKKASKKDYVLWVGRYEKWKNPVMFLEIAEKLKNINFVMICPCSTNCYTNWIKMKNKADKLKNLIFIESVPFNKIQKYFDQTKIFVNTSDSEGFPNSFLQAANSYTPIASLNVNPDNFITKYNCGIVADNNLNKLTDKIEELFFNEKKINEYGNNNFSYLKNNHNLEYISNRFSKLLEMTL